MKPFKIYLKENYFRKNMILIAGDGPKCKVVKVYDLVWWRRFLRFIGFKIKYTYEIKVININE